MKRAHSALSLRNLAMSIKHSIQLDQQRTAKKQSFPVKSIKPVSQSLPKERKSQTAPIQKTLSREQKTNRVFVLEKQITVLQKQLKEMDNCQRDQSKELQEYDSISKLQVQSQKDINSEKMVSEQLRNQILMLQQEIHSTHFNAQSQIAQKQYHEELIDAYLHQYEAEAKLAIQANQIQSQNQDLEQQMKTINQSIEKSQLYLKQWKRDVEFELNEHKLKNNIKILRTKLISLEDKCDDFCSSHNLRKIRELYCLYFKNYSMLHGINREEAEIGIDIFVCKKRLAQDFSEYLRQRLVYNKPKFPLIEQYIVHLTKMQEIFKKGSFEVNKQLHSQYLSDLREFESLKEEKVKEISRNQDRIKNLNDQIDELFNNESIALIEYMREQNKNTYDLKDIKLKLRQNKKEQKIRIKKIKQSFFRIKQLESIIEKNHTANTLKPITPQIQELTENLFSSELQLEQLENRYFKLLKTKNAVEDRINHAITQWRETDQMKLKLQNLYKQLQAVNNHREAFKEEFIIPKYQEPAFKHSKNTSLSSLQQSKSILSLNNPYKKVIERETEVFQPILSNCQMILSNKLTRKDSEFKCYQSKASKLINQGKSNMVRTQSKSILHKCSIDKQNNKSGMKGKKSLASTQVKGKVSLSQRQSLSRLLISRFNRM